MSQFSPEKTMKEVSACFAFPGKYESGDFEEDYEDMEDDPPSSSPLDIQLLDKDTELTNENNIQGNQYVDHFHSLSLCFCDTSFLLYCSMIIHLYKPCLFFVIC